MPFRLIPTRSQYEKWSIPSKATYISLVIGIASFVFGVVIFVYTEWFKTPPFFQEQEVLSSKPTTDLVYLNALLLAVADLSQILATINVESERGVIETGSSHIFNDRLRVSHRSITSDFVNISYLVRFEFPFSEDYTNLPQAFLIKDFVIEDWEAAFSLVQVLTELKRAGIVVVKEEKLMSPSTGFRVTVRHISFPIEAIGEAYEEFYEKG